MSEKLHTDEKPRDPDMDGQDNGAANQRNLGSFDRDPGTTAKKFLLGLSVVALALISVGAFASFHWLCADYFKFKSNEAEARGSLQATRERIAEAEEASKARLAALDEEHSAKRKRLDDEFSAESRRLEDDFQRKKHDLAFSLKNYIERFNEKTNDLERAILARQAELDEASKRISILPDLKKQCEDAEAALSAARTNRDAALANEREAQDSFNEWNGKAGQARAEVEAERQKAETLRDELDNLARQTNAVLLAIAKLNSEKTVVEARIAQVKAEVERIQGEIARAKVQKEGLESEIAGLDAAKAAAVGARDAALTGRDKALELKREAETLRDKAIAEREQSEKAKEQAEASLAKRLSEIEVSRKDAESAFARRKSEIDGLVQDMEKLLKATKRKVESALAAERQGAAATNEEKKEVEE